MNSSQVLEAMTNTRESLSFGKGKETEKKSELPWAIYVDEGFRPVVEWTVWGPLLVGDDGTIFISCMNGKAYAIEAILSFNGTDKADCATNLASILGTTLGSGLPAYHAPIDGGREFENWWQPHVMLNFAVVSAKARSRWGYPDDDKIYGHALLKMNVGNERFDGIVPFLDSDAWNAPPVTLERVKYVSNQIGLEQGQREHVRYRAREIKLGPRETDREETT